MKDIKRNILKTLQACDGVPMPESALISAVQILCRPATPTCADIETGIQSLETDRFIAGAADSITGTSWTLTTKGTHKARQV